MDDLLGRARAAWANYAGIDGGFRPGLVNLGVNARSRICPPGWAGIVLLGNAAIVTAPAAGAERDLRRALSGVPMDQLTDRSAIESVMDVAEVLGPASLAFTDGASFRAVAQSGDAARFGAAGMARYGAAAAARAGGVARAGGAAGPDASSALAVGQLPATDDRLRALLASGPAGQAAETDLARIAAAVHVVLDGDRAVGGWLLGLALRRRPPVRADRSGVPRPRPSQTGRIGGRAGCARTRPADAVACPGSRLGPGGGQPRLRALWQPAQHPPCRTRSQSGPGLTPAEPPELQVPVNVHIDRRRCYRCAHPSDLGA